VSQASKGDKWKIFQLVGGEQILLSLCRTHLLLDPGLHHGVCLRYGVQGDAKAAIGLQQRAARVAVQKNRR